MGTPKATTIAASTAVVRAEAGEQGCLQKQWLVCFADGPLMESLLPGKWKCYADDCPDGLLTGTVSKLNVLKEGLTGQGTAGGEESSAAGTTSEKQVS